MRRLIALLLLPACTAWNAAAGDRQARAGEWERAAAAYEAALRRDGGESATLRYNLGTTLLHLERLPQAREQLETAAAAADPDLRQRTFYNLGNTDLVPVFRGAATEDRLARLERAISAYKRALLLDGSDENAKWNLELAQRLLEEEQRGGGGGADTPRDGRGGGGGGGGETPLPARPDVPEPAGGAGEQPEMSLAAAERLLADAAMAELETQRARLRRQSARQPGVRSW